MIWTTGVKRMGRLVFYQSLSELRNNAQCSLSPFLESEEGGGAQGELLLLRLDRKVNAESHSFPEQRLMSSHHYRTHCHDRKIWTLIDKLLEERKTRLLYLLLICHSWFLIFPQKWKFLFRIISFRLNDILFAFLWFMAASEIFSVLGVSVILKEFGNYYTERNANIAWCTLQILLTS